MQRLWLFWFWHNWIVYYLVMLWMVILPQCKNLLSYLYDKSHPGLKIFFIRQSAHENLSPFLSHSWWYINYSFQYNNLLHLFHLFLSVDNKMEACATFSPWFSPKNLVFRFYLLHIILKTSRNSDLHKHNLKAQWTV